jgi:hypothetical protein
MELKSESQFDSGFHSQEKTFYISFSVLKICGMFDDLDHVHVLNRADGSFWFSSSLS